MRLRKIHQGIIWVLTIGLFAAVACIPLLGERTLAGFGVSILIICAAYAMILIVLGFIFRRNIPFHLRKRPEAPPEFREILFGPVTARIAETLARAAVVKDGEFRKRRHVLYRWERSLPEGIWTGYAEEAAGEVIAWAVNFRSIASPILDFSDSYGQGRFICVPTAS